MRELGLLESLLYNKQNSKRSTNPMQSELVDNLDYISHYFQNEYTKHLPKEIKSKALKLIEKALVSGSDFSTSDDNEVGEPISQYTLFSEFMHPIFKPQVDYDFTFIDLFAGIGGFRLACQNNGGKCVFSSEWDPDAQKTYYHNFGEFPFGDITIEQTKNCIPKKFDILCAGFPCQAFSIAGYRKGFEDTRGTLFFDVATIIKNRRPKAFILENVKNLVAHDNGKTFEVIYNTLTELEYKVFYKVLNSMDYANIPQNRERIIIVGFDPKQVKKFQNFKFPEKQTLSRSIHDCIDYSVDDESLYYRENSPYYKELKANMQNSDTIYQWRRQYVRENKSNVCPTLTANMGTGGHNVPLIVTENGYRKLTPKECLNFQGFPKDYEFPPIAKSKQYKQAGNSVTVPLIQAVIKNILEVL